MSGKTFVGNRASSLKESDKLQPYTKVTVTDGTNSFSSGTVTGRELLVEIPVLPSGDGAALAANILNSVKNYQYRPYEADSALLDPAAELGDGITVGGVYGGIHAKTATFSRLFRANVSAPAEEEIDSEYPYLSAQERDAVRQKKQTAKNTSDIAQNTEDISVNAKNITAVNTRVTNLAADVAEIEQAYITRAEVGTLVANEVAALNLSATYATITSLNSVDSRIDLLIAGTTLATKLYAKNVTATESLYVPSGNSQRLVSVSQVTINGKVYSILTV